MPPRAGTNYVDEYGQVAPKVQQVTTIQSTTTTTQTTTTGAQATDASNEAARFVTQTRAIKKAEAAASLSAIQVFKADERSGLTHQTPATTITRRTLAAAKPAPPVAVRGPFQHGGNPKPQDNGFNKFVSHAVHKFGDDLKQLPSSTAKAWKVAVTTGPVAAYDLARGKPKAAARARNKGVHEFTGEAKGATIGQAKILLHPGRDPIMFGLTAAPFLGVGKLAAGKRLGGLGHERGGSEGEAPEGPRNPQPRGSGKGEKGHPDYLIPGYRKKLDETYGDYYDRVEREAGQAIFKAGPEMPHHVKVQLEMDAKRAKDEKNAILATERLARGGRGGAAGSTPGAGSEDKLLQVSDQLLRIRIVRGEKMPTNEEIEHMVNNVYSHVSPAERKRMIGAVRDAIGDLRKQEYGGLKNHGNTGHHSAAVADTARAIAIEMGYSGIDLLRVQLAGVLHDIGKLNKEVAKHVVSTEDFAWNSPEMKSIRTHPQLGVVALAKLHMNDPVSRIVTFFHHERQDGRGYPVALPGHQIPRGASIVQAADVHAALTEVRPYRKDTGGAAWTHEAALNQMSTHWSNEFHPQVLEALRKAHENGRLEHLKHDGQTYDGHNHR